MVQHLENVELLTDARSAVGHSSSHMAHTPRCPARGSPGKQKAEAGITLKDRWNRDRQDAGLVIPASNLSTLWHSAHVYPNLCKCISVCVCVFGWVLDNLKEDKAAVGGWGIPLKPRYSYSLPV